MKNLRSKKTEFIGALVLAAESVARLIFGLVYLIFSFKLLGSHLYGQLSYAISFAMLFSFLSTFGLQQIIIRELAKKERQEKEIITSAITISLIGGIAAFILATVTSYFISPEQIHLIALAALVFVAQAPHAIRFAYEHSLHLFSVVVIAISSNIITVLTKVTYLAFGSSLTVLVCIDIAAALLVSLLFSYIYRYKINTFFSNINCTLVRHIAKNSAPLALSSAAIIIFGKTDQIMISNILTFSENGEYAFAVTAISALYFIPTVISQTFYPRLLARHFGNNMEINGLTQKILEFTLLLVLPIIFFALAAFPLLIEFANIQGVESSSCFNIMIWSLISVSLGVVTNKWLIAKGLQKVALMRTLAAAVINIFLNLFLIPKYGIEGAAAASVIAHLFSGYFGNIFSSKTRPLFILQTKALTFRHVRQHFWQKHKT